MQRVEQIVELANDDCARDAQSSRLARIKPFVTQYLQSPWRGLGSPFPGKVTWVKMSDIGLVYLHLKDDVFRQDSRGLKMHEDLCQGERP